MAQINGTLGNDTLQGTAGDDDIFGFDGDDYIHGGNGLDLLKGGLGNDVYVASNGRDRIVDEGGDADVLLFDSNTPYVLGFTVNNDGYLVVYKPDTDMKMVLRHHLHSSGQYRIEYIEFVDGVRLKLTDHTQWIWDNGQDDGNSATFDDDIVGDVNGAYADTILAGVGDDKVNGGLENDQIDGHTGNDLLYGNQGDDLIYGGDGDDTLFGDGHWYADYAGDDELHGGGGNDLINGRAGDDLIFGDAGSDNLRGHEGDDILDGGGDFDILHGNQGDDVLYGADGGDFLYGDEGSDRYVFDGRTDLTGATFVSIKGENDFTSTEGHDVIDLRQLLDGATAGGDIDDFLRLTEVGSRTAVEVDIDGTAGAADYVTIAYLFGTSDLAPVETLVADEVILV